MVDLQYPVYDFISAGKIINERRSVSSVRVEQRDDNKENIRNNLDLTHQWTSQLMGYNLVFKHIVEKVEKFINSCRIIRDSNH